MDKLGIGLNTFIVGLGIVFIILAILIATILIMNAVIKLLLGGKKKVDVQVELPKAQAPTAAIQPDSSDDEITAVITAVLAAMGAKQGRQFALKSYKRVGQSAPAWNRAGRQNNYYTYN